MHAKPPRQPKVTRPVAAMFTSSPPPAEEPQPGVSWWLLTWSGRHAAKAEVCWREARWIDEVEVAGRVHAATLLCERWGDESRQTRFPFPGQRERHAERMRELRAKIARLEAEIARWEADRRWWRKEAMQHETAARRLARAANSERSGEGATDGDR